MKGKSHYAQLAVTRLIVHAQIKDDFAVTSLP
jgi:hypothetical protein